MILKWLLLWFEAPLQSWGASSKFDKRETMEFPTKSGVYGLILSAMGASGEQKDLLSRLSDMKMSVFSYEGKNNTNSVLIDYHTVGGGYDEKDPWQNLHIPKKSDGSKPVGTGTKITYRYYLQNAKFGIILEIPQDLEKNIEEALKNPVYQICFGRKNCIPTDFIFRGIFNSYEEANQELSNIVNRKELHEVFKVVDGKEEEGDESFYLKDVPLQFGPIKKYRERLVTIYKK